MDTSHTPVPPRCARWLLFASALWLGACAPKQSAPNPHTPDAPATTAPAAAAFETQPLPARVARGVCLAHNWQDQGARGYGTDAGARTMDHLKGVGVNWVSLTPFGWMRSVHDSTVKGEHQSDMPRGGERREALIGAIEQARARGMKVVLKPHVWIAKGAWRGDIAPRDSAGAPDWATWWGHYTAWMVYYAKLAQQHDVEVLVLGVELVSALKRDPDAFLKLVTTVRTHYKGKLTYSANWDEFPDERVWGALDMVSTQLYPPLSQSLTPKRQALRRALRPHLKRWSEVAGRAGTTLWLSEVGYTSALNAVSKPFEWPERLDPSLKKPAPALQALAYEALFAELRTTPRVGGVFVWKYFTDADTDEEGEMGFSPRGKPAEGVLKQAYILE